ncbi:MFS transporter small subunit [Streptomyces flavofungini]|uniref:ABC transporter permease n=1 Tax=Streptomyces flavofungini TaxID=68200 RepID=A0ABS0X5J3_9ACTN|nr:hypothetical protein [Streptomyces flavofungini]MBJ3808371.1 hypothetical protein [Streptomyces flavofungini]GHC58216.1 hypothetical protein GCM10010349_26520 [Streptomyces flavofungini]
MTTPPSPQPRDRAEGTPAVPVPAASQSPPGRRPLIVGAWLWVGLPLAYGVYELVHKAKQLFTG